MHHPTRLESGLACPVNDAGGRGNTGNAPFRQYE